MNKISKKFAIVLMTFILLTGLLYASTVDATVRVLTPEEKPYDIEFKKIAAGLSHTIAIDENGNLWAWGANTYGQLGNGTTIDSALPVQISDGTVFKEVSAGVQFSVALDQEGNIWTWGYNEDGQLGNGTNNNSTTPKKLTTSVKFKTISAGNWHVMAIDVSGYLWTCGYNLQGQLGNDEVVSSNTLQKIHATTTYKAIAAGGYHSMAIDTSGKLWAWGANRKGQLGNGANLISYDPVQIKAGTTFTAVAAGDYHTMAIDSAGNLWTWGENEYGQLGNGTTTNSSLPVQVKQGTKFKAISAGGDHSLAIDNSGNLWSFGHNEYGQLGNGKIIDSSLPVQIKPGTTFKEISAGGLYTMTIDSIGNTWGWGYNGNGRIGDATTETSSIPVLVAQKRYTVTFKNNGEVVKEERVPYGQGATAPEPTKAGYDLSWDKDFSNITQAITVNAVWTARTDTPYKVEHYFITTDETEEDYTLEITDELTGTTDTTATAVAKTITGFTYDENNTKNVKTGTIAGDGSLVLKLYYIRNKYNVSYELNGGTLANPINEYTYGIGATLPTTATKVGHTFDGWYDNEELAGEEITEITTEDYGDKTFYAKWSINSYTVTFKDGDEVVKTESVLFNNPATAPEISKQGYNISWDKDFSIITDDTTVNAVWIPKNNTKYRIEYYLRNTDTEVEGYILGNSEEKAGTTDAEVEATIIDISGFTYNPNNSNNVTSGTIAADESLVLKLYYNRNLYDIEYVLNGGHASGLSNQYLYGKELILSKKVTKEGYTFDGWYDNESLQGNKITKIETVDIGNKTFYAKWKEVESFASSEVYSIDDENKYITQIDQKTTLKDFLDNIQINGTAVVVDQNGDELANENALIGTGCKLQVTIGEVTEEYTIIINGDINGDGKVTVTDLSTMAKLIVGKIQSPTAVQQKAADLDGNGKVSATDLSSINQIIAGK